MWLWEGRPVLAREEQVKRQGVRGGGLGHLAGAGGGRGGRWEVGQRGESEQDEQGLLGHRKDSTGSQMSCAICLRF